MSPAQIIEFLLTLLMAASVIAILANRFRVPYTVALVIGGFCMDFFHVPIANMMGEGQASTHLLTPEVVFILFLPALLFEAGINLNLRQLRHNLLPISLLAVGGVLIAMFTTGYAVHWASGIPLMSALVFGALISATDPISVLALFKDLGVSKRLSVLVEGESLFNDGTAVVLFQILLAAVASGGINVADGIRQFVIVAAGGAALGLVIGYAASRITAQVDDARIEITLTTIVAYGSYLLAEQLHVSGVIATVAAGLMVGNFGAEIGMSPRTRVALWGFWDYLSFVVNSLVFLLIGVEVHIVDLLQNWKAVLVALAMVLLGRAIAVYSLVPLSNLMSEKIPAGWQHVAVWGGVHGGVSIALALSLSPSLPGRDTILTMTFGVVAFSIVVQGLTIKPLLGLFGVATGHEDEFDRVRVQAIAIGAARSELEQMRQTHLVRRSVYDTLCEELESRMNHAREESIEIEAREPEARNAELLNTRMRLVAAEKSAIQRSANEGVVSKHTADKLLTETDERLDKLEEETS